MTTVKFIIDNRESIKNSFPEIDNKKMSNLKIGDYHYLLDEEVFIIIERKTIADYAASIRDSRSREQKKRMMDNKASAFVLYLVEGDLTKNNSSFNYNKVEKNTIISSIVNTMIRDEINVFHTSSKEETIFFLTSIYKKLVKQGRSFLKTKSSYNEDLVNNMCKGAKINKSKNLTPKLCFQMMLNCIPSVSNKISERISAKFENLVNFVTFMESSEDMEDVIVNIRMSDSESARKISKKAAHNIVAFMNS